MNNKDDSKKEENNIVFVKIGQRIQKHRIQRNLTQDQVAEQGYHNPRFDMVIQIAKALNVPTDAFAKDLSDDNVDVFLESIRPNIEKLNVKQLEYLKKNIELLLEL